jgi:hypothetical protein
MHDRLPQTEPYVRRVRTYVRSPHVAPTWQGQSLHFTSFWRGGAVAVELPSAQPGVASERAHPGNQAIGL